MLQQLRVSQSVTNGPASVNSLIDCCTASVPPHVAQTAANSRRVLFLIAVNSNNAVALNITCACVFGSNPGAYLTSSALINNYLDFTVFLISDVTFGIRPTSTF